MQCETFEIRIQQSLDERLSLSLSLSHDQDLVGHAEGCAACSEVLAAYETLFEGFAQRPPVELGGDFTDRVLRELNPPESPSLSLGSRQGQGPSLNADTSSHQSFSRFVGSLAPWLIAASIAFAAFWIFGSRNGSQTPNPEGNSFAEGPIDPAILESVAQGFREFDSSRFHVDRDQIVSVGYATGRTMARLPEKMQIAASSSVSVTLEALRRSSENRSSELQQQPTSIQNKTSDLGTSGIRSMAIV